MKFTNILTIGEILVEFISHQRNCGLERIAEYSGPYPSGAPAIYIDQAARMGANAQILGGVGDDGFGRITIDRLAQNGVDIASISVSPKYSTGVAFVSYYDDGHRDFIFHLTNTAADHFDPSGLKASDPTTTLMHVSASSLGNPILREIIMGKAAELIQNGGKVSCDPNARAELMRDDAARQALHDIINMSQILLPSTSDLSFLFPDFTEQQAVEALLSKEAEIIALKQGEKGATIYTSSSETHFEPHKVEEIDPTGAGDCFCGTFTAMLALGHSPEEAGKFANAAGALAVTKRGPMEGNSSPDDIRAFLQAQN